MLILGLLTPADILLPDVNEPRIKLARYGIYEIGNGFIDNLIGNLWYLAPERLAALQQGSMTATFKSDVWAIGIVLLSVFTKIRIEDIWGKRQILNVLYSLIKQGN